MTQTLATDLFSLLICPACQGELRSSESEATCGTCKKIYPVRDGKVFMQQVPADIVESVSPTAPETWTDWRKANFSFLSERIKTIAGKDSVLLDVGCGPSQFYSVLGQYRLVSCDIYPYARVDVVVDLSRQIPFKEQSFDVIHLSNVLEHIERPVEFTASLAGLLKPGGHVIAMVPFMAGEHQAPYDFHRYTRFGLKALFSRAGLDIVDLVSYGDALALSTELAGQTDQLLKKQADLNPTGSLKLARILLRISLSFSCRINRFIRKLLKIPDLNSPLAVVSPYGFMFVAKKNRALISLKGRIPPGS